jgi:hypothetical protein
MTYLQIGILAGLGVFLLAVIGCFGLMLLYSNQPASPQNVKPTNIPTSTKPPEPFTGKWQVSTKKSEFDDSTTVHLILPAENEIEGWVTTYRPNLVLRCQEGEIDAIVDIGMPAEIDPNRSLGAHIVRVRFDNNPAFEAYTKESSDGDALFFFTREYMVIDMLKSREMTFGFTPFNADPVVTKFDLRGLSNVIEPLKEACNWDGNPPQIPQVDLPTVMETVTPLPSESPLTIHGEYSGDWKVEIDKIIITDSVSSNGEITRAEGQFVLLFLKVTNIGNDAKGFSGHLQLRIIDAEGNLYDAEDIASKQASDMYGVEYGTLSEPKWIEPNNTVMRLAAFDLPLDSSTYLLVPGVLADVDGQSIILEIHR